MKILDDVDIEQIKTRYENAKTEAIRLRKENNPEFTFEYGRAYALEGILRMLEFDVTEVTKGLF